MIAPEHELLFGNNASILHTSEASFLDALQRSNRPLRDASFVTKHHGMAKAKCIKVGGIVITTAAGSPVHLETDSDPQFCLLISTSGSGSIAQRSRMASFVGKNIIRSSYQHPLLFDYGDYSGLTIRADIPLLLNALSVADADRDLVAERLLDTNLEQLPSSLGNIDYYGAFLSLMRMIDAADCNETQLERVGFHRLLTFIIADLTLKTDKRLADL